MHTINSEPVVSVVVSSDFAAGEERSWDDMRAALHAVATQNFAEPAECILLESADFIHELPGDLNDIVPDLKIVAGPVGGSYKLKNEAFRVASAEYVVLLDADCVPERDWLRRLVDCIRAHPEAAAVSSKTEYAGHNLMERILSLLSRSYADPGGTRETRFITNNSAIYRRELLLSHPLPLGLGPFAARLQSEALHRAGWKVWFEPRTRVIHAFDGWSMERDIRRNFGYATIVTRKSDLEMPFAGLLRFGRLSIPVFFALRTLDSWWNCLRVGRDYGVAWYQTPLAFSTAVVLHLLEIPGMLRAFAGEAKPESTFR